MARKSRNSNLHDELNFARFGVISMHSRVDQSISTWSAEFCVHDRTFRIEAVTPEGRPHGIDTDTLIALETLFVAQGCPDDNWVHTTAYEVREVMGMANNGENYKRLRQSIRRLYFTTVIVGRRTALEGTQRAAWDNVGVRFFEGLRYRDREDDGDLSTLDSEATLSIRLGDQLADSIRAGISQVLDGHLLYQLEQPPARALYRTLQAHRRQDDGQMLMELSIPLTDWRHATGITTDRSDLVRRALVAAHDELLANNYLETAVIEGRGKNATAHYVFTASDAPDPALVVMLRQAGVTVARATALAAKFPNRVEEALKFLELRQKVSGKVRNPGGLVSDYLEHPEKYTLPEEFAEVQEDKENQQKVAKDRAKEAKRRAELEAEQQAEANFQELLALSPAQQWEAQAATLNLMLKKHLNSQELKLLERLAREGRILATELARDLVAATARAQFKEQVIKLKKQLMPLFAEAPARS